MFTHSGFSLAATVQFPCKLG